MKQILFVNNIEIRQKNKKYIHLEYLDNKSEDFDLQDLKRLINLRYDSWLTEAKNFHEKISIFFSGINKNWWLTDSSRFIMWKTKNNYSLNNYFYSKAILEITEKYDEVVVVGKNDVIKKYIESVEEVINIPMLMKIFEQVLKAGKGASVIEEIVLQSRVEFNVEAEEQDILAFEQAQTDSNQNAT